MVSGGGDVCLSGVYIVQCSGIFLCGLVVLFYGWEGSFDFIYVLQIGSCLLVDGWDVFWFNFCDYGDSYYFNEVLFYFCCIDEVVYVLGEIVECWLMWLMVLVGFLLGGNFVLCVGLVVLQYGILLVYVLVVCLIIDLVEGLFLLEKQVLWFYQVYFMQKWCYLLCIKQVVFLQYIYFELVEFKQNLCGLIEVLVLWYIDFDLFEVYLDGYLVVGDVLQVMQIFVIIMIVWDDLVILVNVFEQLCLLLNIELDIVCYGGYCGFICGWDMMSFIDDYIVVWFNVIVVVC